ncbi:MAG: di-trans,poly-cis-decaprenylcistransferase [Bacilli bacterium]|nr:di-trans,poly-cis-decaprenylcistransferase [Bacilli bacterium]
MELKIPNHVAIICDGNGRWAKERGLARTAGHKAGSEIFTTTIPEIFKMGVKIVSVFVFSRENFKRSKEEVNFLMDLFVKLFNTKLKKYKETDIKVVFSGTDKPLEDRVLKAMDKIVEETKDHTKHILNVCLNYSGDYEIVDAAKKFAQDYKAGKVNLDDLTTDSFYNYLYQPLDPIDLLIRTSGEYRLSNFMLYQLSYAEICFPKTYFPDFTKEEFIKCLEEYSKRDRRFGGIKDEDKSN